MNIEDGAERRVNKYAAITKYTLQTSFLLGALATVFAYVTNFEPSIIGFLIGCGVALLLITLTFYEKKYHGDSAFCWGDMERISLYAIAICALVSYLSIGIYAIGWIENTLFGNASLQMASVKAVGQTGGRKYKCNSTIKVRSFKAEKSKVICVSSHDYQMIEKAKSYNNLGYKEIYLVYRSSNFGRVYQGLIIN
jgi:hypothetical protein